MSLFDVEVPEPEDLEAEEPGQPDGDDRKVAPKEPEDD
jgi:hypothetical protein